MDSLGDWGVYVPAVVLVLGGLYKVLRFTYDVFKDFGEFFAVREFKRLLLLQGGVRGGTPVFECLEKSIELEALRVKYKIRGNYREMVAYMKIEQVGLWSLESIRALRKYLKCPAGIRAPEIVITAGHKFEAGFSIVLCVLVYASAIFLCGVLFWKLNFFGVLLGSCCLVVTTAVCASLAGSAGELNRALEIKRYLSKHPEILEE